MWTIKYKGVYIHGYCDKQECKALSHVAGVLRFKSLHAAKIAITKGLIVPHPAY